MEEKLGKFAKRRESGDRCLKFILSKQKTNQEIL